MAYLSSGAAARAKQDAYAPAPEPVSSSAFPMPDEFDNAPNVLPWRTQEPAYSPEPSYDPYSASQGVDLAQGPYSGGDPGFGGSLRTAGQNAYNFADTLHMKGPAAYAIGAASGARPYGFQPGEINDMAQNYAIGSVGNGPHLPGAAGEGIDAVIARLRAKGLTPAEAMHDPEFIALQAKSGFMPDYNAKPADAVNASDVTVNLRRAREADARAGAASEMPPVSLDAPWPTDSQPGPQGRGTWQMPRDSARLPSGTDVSMSSYGDAVPGGYNGGWRMTDAATGDQIGRIEYQSAPGTNPLVAWIEVAPKYRASGASDALIARLKAEFPGQRIDPGMLTDDGARMWQRVESKVNPPQRGGGEAPLRFPEGGSQPLRTGDNAATGATPVPTAPTSILERARAKANEPRLPDTESQQQAIRAVIRDERQHAGLPSVQEQQNTYIAALENAATVEPGNRVAASIGQGFEDSLRVMQQAEQALGPEAALQVLREHRRDAAGFPRALELIDNRIKALSGGEAGFTTVGNMLRPGVTNALGAGAGGVAGNAATPEDASPSERLWNIAIGAAGGLGAAALARKFPGEAGSFELGPRDNAPRPIGNTPSSGRATVNTPVPTGRAFVQPEDTKLTVAQHVNDILSAPLSYLTGIDASAPGRQLFRSLVAHPGDVMPVLKAQFSAMRSEKNFAALQEAWRNDPIRPLMDQMGVELGDLGGNIGKREEYIQSTLPERTPVVGGLYRRTNAGYTAAINTRRILLSKLAVGQMPELVWKGTELLPEGLQELQRRGRLINAATGRGNMGEAFRESKVLGQPLFFAIRNRIGNMQVPLSALTSKSAWVRREAQKQMAGQIAFLGGLFATGKATGAWDVEADPRSSDWGQVRIGNRRFDFTAGMRPLVNVLAREGASIFNALPGTTDISNYKGINTPQQEGGLFTRKATEVLTNYMRGALAPTLGEAWTQLEGTDIIGQPIDQSLGGRAVHAAQGLLPALFLQQLAEELSYTVPKGYQQGGIGGAAAEAGKSAASAVPYFSGVGGSYYQPRAPQIAAEGGYSGLKGEDQLAGVKAQAWTTIQNAQGAPDEVKQIGSYYDWRKHETARLFDQLSKAEGAPTSSGEVLAAVEKIIGRHPYTKAWETVRAKLEDQWVKDNPELTMKLYDQYKNRDADFQRSHADWNFNEKQRDLARKTILATSPAKKQSTRLEKDKNDRVTAVIEDYGTHQLRRTVERGPNGRVVRVLEGSIA